MILRSLRPVPGKLFLRAFEKMVFVEGDNIVIERRFAEGMANWYPKLIAELIELNPDVLITSAIPATMAAKRATNSIPIVMLNVADPLKEGIIANLLSERECDRVGTIRNHGNYDQANSVTQRCDAERFKGWRFG